MGSILLILGNENFAQLDSWSAILLVVYMSYCKIAIFWNECRWNFKREINIYKSEKIRNFNKKFLN